MLYIEDLGVDTLISGEANLILLQNDHQNISSISEVSVNNALTDYSAALRL